VKREALRLRPFGRVSRRAAEDAGESRHGGISPHRPQGERMVQQKATNITRHASKVTGQERRRLMGHEGAVLWFTGLSGSGKSTLATTVERILFERGCHTYVLDGDNVRLGLNRDLGFSPEDREENIRRIGEVAHLFADAGLIAVTAFISPYSRDRNVARGLNAEQRFIEVYCRCPVEVCEQRDPKGLYKKARAGEIRDFTGIDAPYEEPSEPEVTVETDRETVAQSAAHVVRYMENAGIIPPAP
jgi:adenylylsulfate kinase